MPTVHNVDRLDMDRLDNAAWNRAGTTPTTGPATRRNRRRHCLVGLIALALVSWLVSCGQTTSDPTQPATEVSAETEAAAVVETTQPAATASEVAEPVSGRVALANAQGNAHVLWFWGAH